MRILKVMGVSIGVLAVLAIIAELMFGSWNKGPDYGALNIPRNVSHHFDVSGLYAGGGRITYSRDGYGLRGPYGDLSGIDILTIGGSTTNQLNIDDDATWQANLRRLFAAARLPRTIVDAAVDGQSTRGHIAVFERWLPLIDGLKARYVLAYVGINDVSVDSAEQWDNMESPDASRRLRYQIMNKSALYNLFRTTRGMFKAYNAKLVHGGSTYDGLTWVGLDPDAVMIAPAVPDLAERLAAYRHRLNVLVGKIRGFGAEAILVTQPTAEFRVREEGVYVPLGADGVAAVDPYRVMRAFNLVTLDVCREQEAICVDLARTLRSEDGDFYDRLHNTPQGAAKVAKGLFDALISKM